MTRNPFAAACANLPRIDPAKHKLDPDQKPSGFVPGPAWNARRPSIGIDQMAKALVAMAGGDEHKLSTLKEALDHAVAIEMGRDPAKDARGAGL